MDVFKNVFSFVGSEEFKYVNAVFISKIYILIPLYNYMLLIQKCRIMKN